MKKKNPNVEEEKGSKKNMKTSALINFAEMDEIQALLKLKTFASLKEVKRMKGGILFEDGNIHMALIDGNRPVEAKRAISTFSSNDNLAIMGVVAKEHENKLLSLIPKEFLFDYVIQPFSKKRLAITFGNLLGRLKTKHSYEKLSTKWEDSARNLKELNEIGIALSAERDTDRLLDLIVEKGRDITNADAGSLYIVEDSEDRTEKRLRFKVSQNFSLTLSFSEFTLPITPTSIAGSVAYHGKTLNIEDVYSIPKGSSFGFNRSFDERNGYRSKSMLTVPMKNRAGEVIGVLQFLNAKRDYKKKLSTPAEAEEWVIPFSDQSVEMTESLGSQAAVSLENAILYKEIQELFDSFVRASVSAIESRDPTTSGHSGRVAQLTVGLAKAVNKSGSKIYSRIKFSPDELKEMEYAGLLHDFGKIGVREQVLVKAKKLYEGDYERIVARFAYLKKDLEARFNKEKLERLLKVGEEKFKKELKALNAKFKSELEELDLIQESINKCNIPTVLPEGCFDKIKDLSSRTYTDINGVIRPMLSEDEVINLSLPKGSLNNEERLEIESHVTHTFQYLKKIPWIKKYQNIPEIAYAHHEKLNGKGYPTHKPAEDIPIQSRMMTISDIFDALTASDRPYKKAVPVQKALDILGMEANAGLLDTKLLDVFLGAKVYELTSRIN